MNKTQVQSYTAVITCGMREGYFGILHARSEVRAIIQAYCDEVGLSVEVHFGRCVYTNGSEPCVRVSLINYPRFPKPPGEIFAQAEELGMLLANATKQLRFTVVATDKTVMYEM